MNKKNAPERIGLARDLHQAGLTEPVSQTSIPEGVYILSWFAGVADLESLNVYHCRYMAQEVERCDCGVVAKLF